MEIKFKPEPEKNETGAGTSPENVDKTLEKEGSVKEKNAKEEPIAVKKEDAKEPVSETDEIGAEEENVENGEVKRHRRSRRSQKPDESEKAVKDKAESAEQDGVFETVGEPVEKKPLRGWQKVLLGVGVIVLAVLMTFGFSIWREYSRTESAEGDPVEVTIAQGSSTRQVAAELKEAGVIRYETAFLMKIYFSFIRGKLRYGTFELNDGMCLADVIETLVTGGAQKEEASFTIPEGYSVPMIAEKLENEGVMSQDEFLTAVKNAAADFAYADVLPPADQVFYQLEGYIYPDTYYLSEDMTGDELVAKILDEFENKFDEQRQQEAAAMGMSVEEVLIRASLVQKETERPEEYSMVAGVINNRLAQNMRLQFDSTVVYALSKGMFGVERVLYDHLEIDSPYNTYRNKGLPVGPICNPSLDAIDGVLHPAEHNYLYFQTDQVKNDGSNLYFETYEEHAAAAATTQAPGASTGQSQGSTETTAAPDNNAAPAADGTTAAAGATAGTVTSESPDGGAGSSETATEGTQTPTGQAE